jgi:tetratricopeptide (TPR) repeat protein
LNHNIVGPDKYPIRYSAGQAYVPFQYYWENDHALFLEPLAAAYYRSGDLDKTHQEYEKITSLTVGRTAWGDIYAKSFYMLGKIAEQQRDKGRAIENYRKFLDLWKDADPGTPEVEDAKKRLAGIS